MPGYYRSPKGYHRHQCSECGHVWEHSDDMHDDEAAHTCPGCRCVPVFRFLRPDNWTRYTGPLAPTESK